MSKKKREPGRVWISNFKIAQAKRVCEFFFGDFFISCKLNEKEMRFDIRIHKSLKLKQKLEDQSVVEKEVTPDEYIPLDYFKRYWGPQWNLIFVKEEDVESV